MAHGSNQVLPNQCSHGIMENILDHSITVKDVYQNLYLLLWFQLFLFVLYKSETSLQQQCSVCFLFRLHSHRTWNSWNSWYPNISLFAVQQNKPNTLRIISAVIWSYTFDKAFDDPTMLEINKVFLHWSSKFLLQRRYNQSCIAMTQKQKFSPRTKHIALKYHHFREFVKGPNLKIWVAYVHTESQEADIFTNPVKDK